MSRNEQKRKSFTKWRIDLIIHDALAIARKQKYEHVFWRVLSVVTSRSELLSPRSPTGYAGWLHADRFMRGLLALARQHKHWLRSIEEWQSQEMCRHRQFAELAEHLFARRRVPGFMNKVWFESWSPEAAQHQKLYRHLGLGNSIRGVDKPLRLSRTMAKFIEQVPDHLTVEQAFRWCQVRGMGADRSLANEIVQSRLGVSFANEKRWTRILKMVIDRKEIDVLLVRSLIDYLYENDDPMIDTPSCRVSNRELNSFLHRVCSWAGGQSVSRKRYSLRWNQTGIRGLRFIDAGSSPWSYKCWTIRELLTGRELFEEGRDLRHCVASYIRPCWRRHTSIWSMERHGSLESDRVLTIQVIPHSRKIITALGYCNARPLPDERSVMERWAAQEELEIASWV